MLCATCQEGFPSISNWSHLPRVLSLHSVGVQRSKTSTVRGWDDSSKIFLREPAVIPRCRREAPPKTPNNVGKGDLEDKPRCGDKGSVPCSAYDRLLKYARSSPPGVEYPFRHQLNPSFCNLGAKDICIDEKMRRTVRVNKLVAE